MMKGMCTYCGENPVWAKGLCRNCYQRNRRNGTPEKLKRKRGPRDHQASERKIKVWEEQGRSFTKAAIILGCSKQAVHDAVKRYRKPTNADRIRSMTDEELAVFLGNTQAFCCIDHDPSEEFIAEFKTWLKEEAADD